MPDFILAGISGASEPRETGRLSGCTASLACSAVL
jgi:hypothetical protein